MGKTHFKVTGCLEESEYKSFLFLKGVFGVSTNTGALKAMIARCHAIAISSRPVKQGLEYKDIKNKRG